MAQTQVPTRFLAGSYETIDHTPSSAVYAGDVVVLETNLVYIAVAAIAANVLGALARHGGRWVGPKKSGEAIAVGAKIYWDEDGSPLGGTAETGAFTQWSTGNLLAGVVTKAAEATDATVEFSLNEYGNTPIS